MVMFCVSVLASVRGCAVCGELMCRGWGCKEGSARLCSACPGCCLTIDAELMLCCLLGVCKHHCGSLQ